MTFVLGIGDKAVREREDLSIGSAVFTMEGEEEPSVMETVEVRSRQVGHGAQARDAFFSSAPCGPEHVHPISPRFCLLLPTAL